MVQYFMYQLKKMKLHNNIQKRIYQLVVVVLSGVATASCTSHTPKLAGNTSDSAKSINEQKFNANNVQDAQFVADMTELNLQVIQLAQLAQQKSKVTAVKELGRTILDAHTKSLRELKILATKKSITIPSTIADTAKDSYHKMSDLTGNDFDREYCRYTVSGHRALITLFEKETTEAVDPDIKQWVIKTLPDLRIHLTHAIESEEIVTIKK